MEGRDVLARVSLFADVLTARQLDELAAKCRIYEVPPGTVLMAEGDFGTSMFVIVDGTVEISIAGERGRSRSVAKLGPDDFVGEISLMTGARRLATVTALSNARVMEITKVALEAMLTRSPELFDRFAAVFTERQADISRAAAREHAHRILGFRTDEIVGVMRRFLLRTTG